MARLAQAALAVSRDDIREYRPGALDVEIAQAMLQGCISVPEIATAAGRTDSTIRHRLKDPIAFAWIADKVSSLIYTRIGQVDAALLAEACRGNVKAMELYYKRFGKLAELKIVAHGSLGDLSQYSDSDLDRTIAAELKQNPGLLEPSPSQSSTVVDVTPEEAPLETRT